MHMNIRKMVMILGMLLAGLPAVSAQGAFSNLGGTMERMFGPILLSFNSTSFNLWGKILLWVLVFSLLYAVSFKVPILKDKKNIQIVVTMILALITVLPLSESLIRALFQTYGVMISFFLIAVPIIGIIYFSHKAFADNKRLQYAMKAIIFYLLAVIISNVTGAVQASFDLGFSTGFANMSGFAIGICFLLFIWNLFRAIVGGPDEFPRENIAGSGMPDWIKNLAKGEEKPPETRPSTPKEALPPNLGKALRIIQNNIKEYENIFNALPGMMDRLLTLRRQQLFPHPEGQGANIDAIDDLTTRVRDLKENLITKGNIINNMLRDIRQNNPEMRHDDERRLADLAGLWQAKLFITNNYLIRARTSYARGGGPIGKP